MVPGAQNCEQVRCIYINIDFYDGNYEENRNSCSARVTGCVRGVRSPRVAR